MNTAMLERTDTASEQQSHASASWQDNSQADALVLDLAQTRQPKAQSLVHNASSVKTLARRAFYGVWRVLPGWCQALAFGLAAPKVSLGACAVIVDARGRVLMAHHTYRQRAWGLPGGLIRQDEQPAAALARELREELGVAALVGPLLYAETCTANHHLTLYYCATIIGQPQPDGVEIDSYCYASVKEVPAFLGTEARPWLACLEQRRTS